MVILNMLTWWYTLGWRDFINRLVEKMRAALSFFSVGALFRTLFAPFRQISAEEAGPSLQEKFQAFIDRSVSRLVGAVVRIFLMIVGLLVFILEFLVSIVLILAWPLMPLFPIGCIALAVMGVTL